MMLDDKGAVKAERLGLDIVVDEVAEPLGAVEFAARRGPRRRAAEQTEPHDVALLSSPPGDEASGGARCSKCRFLSAV